MALLMAIGATTSVFSAETIDIGGRLELLIDDHLIGELKGDVRRQLLRPEPKEVVFVADKPWEGNTSGYYTYFQDGDIYCMIYRGWQHDAQKKAAHKEVTCYAESKDGIHWTRPNLGLFEWNGSKENNIVWRGPGTHNFTAFRDDNPATPTESRYKAFGGGRGGLLPFQSPDCKHWELIQDKPVITHGAFDSQNLAFWDTDRGEYRAYWRYFRRWSALDSHGDLQGFHRLGKRSRPNLHRRHAARASLHQRHPEVLPRAAPLYRLSHALRGEEPAGRADSDDQSRRTQAFHRYAEAVIPRTAPKGPQLTTAATTWPGVCSNCPTCRTRSRSTARRITTNPRQGESGDLSIAWTVLWRCAAVRMAAR